MKIAFTSCIDAIDDPTQPVWDRIRNLAPDVLVLLGDTMYMDYGIALLGSNRPVGGPRKLADDDFAKTMHARYKLQWSVKSFRGLLASGPQLAMVWDDHDFAWNNARGLGTEKHFAVSREKRLIAQGLFRQFREACGHMEASIYPAMPPLGVLLGASEAASSPALTATISASSCSMAGASAKTRTPAPTPRCWGRSSASGSGNNSASGTAGW